MTRRPTRVRRRYAPEALKRKVHQAEKLADSVRMHNDPTRGLTQFQCDAFTRDRIALNIGAFSFEAIRDRMKPLEYYRSLRRGANGERIDTRDIPERGPDWFKKAKRRGREQSAVRA